MCLRKLFDYVKHCNDNMFVVIYVPERIEGCILMLYRKNLSLMSQCGDCMIALPNRVFNLCMGIFILLNVLASLLQKRIQIIIITGAAIAAHIYSLFLFRIFPFTSCGFRLLKSYLIRKL